MTIIKTKLSEKEFINANLVLMYKKSSVKFLTVLSILLFLTGIAGAVFGYWKDAIGMIAWPVVLACVFPLMTYITAKRMYKTNARTKEQIDYEFQNDLFVIRGESFNAQLTWNKIYKVTATKNWLFIWQNSQAANPIPKKDIWEGEIMKLKEILNASGVKNNL